MSIIDAAANRSRTTIAALVLVLVTGLVAYINIPKEADPDVDIPIIYVSMHHEGISPEDAERLLVRPMETEMRSIEGVKEMRSTAYQSGANVLLEFEAGFDADQALNDVREKVDIAKTELPDDTDEPTVNEVNLSEFPVLVVTLGGDVPERTLLRLARDLQDRVEGIPSVLEATIGGDRDEQVEIIIDPMLIEAYNLDAQQILAALSRSNTLIAAGNMDTGQGRFSVKVPGLFESAVDILEMPLKVSGDSVITVKDVAVVRRSFKDRETIARINGKPALTLEVSKRVGENIIDTINAVRTTLEAERAAWPAGVEVLYSQDKSNDIRSMLTDLQNNVTSAILLVMVIIVGVLGVRSGFLVGVAIPGSFLTGMLVLSVLGLTVNIVVLFSLILAVGMLVDGAIVVTEYADRKMREGEPPERAYKLAAKRMSWPIIASTATTLAAFAPLLFWPGIVGEFMKFLPITLVATLSASLLMALVFIPVLGMNLGGIVRMVLVLGMTGGAAALAGGAVYAVLGGLIGLPTGPIVIVPAAIAALAAAFYGVRAGLWLGDHSRAALSHGAEGSEEIMQALAADAETDLDDVKGPTGVYVRVLHRALRHPGKILACAVLVLVGSWVASGQFGRGVEFFPDVEPEQAKVRIHGRGNLSVNEKAGLVGQVEAEVLAMQAERGEFKTIYLLAGNVVAQDDDAEDTIGTILLELADWDERRKADDILAEVKTRTAHLAGIHVETEIPRAGPPVGKPVQLHLSSRYPELLEAEIVKARGFFEQLEGLKDVEDSRPIPAIEWEINVDRAQAAKFGADVQMIGSFVQFITKGLKVSEYRPDDSDDEIDIVARYPQQYRTIDELDRLRVTTADGPVPIGNFVERSARQQTGSLRRTDGLRVMTVKADVLPDVLTNDMVKAIAAWLPTADIDPRVTWEFKGEDEEQQNAQAFLMKAFGIALFIMALILVTQFNSFYSALLILSAVIMSTVGVMLGLLIIGEPFGIIMSGVGVIALAGIVVNNNIVLIDTFDRLRKTTPDPMQAILRTGAQRLRPVMLTTVTTICGLMPMVLQTNIDFFTRQISIGAPSTQWWVQLATAIAFGLAFATILTLIVTPSALMARENAAAWWDRRQAAKAAALAAPAPDETPPAPPEIAEAAE